MSLTTIITMILILGLVWGGVVFFMIRAFKYEKIKESNGKRQS